jgi:hypothetical protein
LRGLPSNTYDPVISDPNDPGPDDLAAIDVD